MVEAFLPHTPQKAFAYGVGSWSMNRRFEQLDAIRRYHSVETGSILAVVITDQILWCLPIRRRFPQLLRHPGIGRRASDADMDDLACLELDNEEREEWLKEEINDLQEITCPDLPCVVAEKRAPLLTSWRLCANVPHVLLDGALADTKAQFQQFPANPFSTPESILPGHLFDQGDRFGGDSGLASSSLGCALPIPAKELPMPAQ